MCRFAGGIPECLRAPLLERMVHGSDFPVPVHGHFAWLRGSVDWKSFSRRQRDPNILERDYQLKRAMGFPPASFTRIRWLYAAAGIAAIPRVGPVPAGLLGAALQDGTPGAKVCSCWSRCRICR